MIRLLLAQLRHSPAVFTGPFLTAIVTAVFVQLAAIFWWSVVTSSGQDAFVASGDPAGAATFSTLGLFILILGVGLPAIIAFISVGRDSVALLRSQYARWRLAGVTPGQVLAAVVLQTVLLILPASLLALAVSLPASEAAVGFVMTLGSTRANLPVSVSWQPLVLSLTVAMAFALIGGIGPGVRAARVRAIEALRDAATGAKTSTIARAVLLIVLTGVGVTVGVNVATAPGGSGGASMLTLVGILTALIAVAGPLVYPPAIRLWTRLLAPEHAPAVFLARHSSSADGTTAAAIITPILIAGALLSGYFSGAGTYQAAIELIGRDYSINLLQGLILFGPAAVIGLVAGLVGVLTRSGPDTRAATLLRTAGATPGILLAIPAIETAVYAVTTLAFCAVVVLVPTALYAVGFANSQGLHVPIVVDMRAALALTFIASAVIFVIRATPTVRNSINGQVTAM